MIIIDDMLRLKCTIIFVIRSKKSLGSIGKKGFLGIEIQGPLESESIHDETVHQAKEKPFSLDLGLLDLTKCSINLVIYSQQTSSN